MWFFLITTFFALVFFGKELYTTTKVATLTIHSLILSILITIKTKFNNIRIFYYNSKNKNVNLILFLKKYISFRFREYLIKKLDVGYLKKGENSFSVSYYDGENKYKIVFPKNRKVRQIVKAENSSFEDFTKEILQILGPSHNFHGIETTPYLLGQPEGLTIFYRNGSSLFFNSYQNIKISSF